MKLLVVLGEGGHTTELLRLVDLLGDSYDYHYIVAEEDKLSVSHIRRPGPVYSLRRPRHKEMSISQGALKTVAVSFRTLWLLLRLRPAAILSTGPAIAVPVSLLGKVVGARIIFIETGSRVKELSLTGRIMYNIADLFFVQWPQLQEKRPRAIYAGRLL
jgi:beta-1,4-N-acetylglucosaminyltransferase